MNIEEIVIACAAEAYEVDAANITLDTDIREDLSNQSMLMIAFISGIEDETGANIELRDADVIAQVAAENGFDLSIVKVVDTKDTAYQEELAERYGNLEKKALSKKYVQKRIATPLFLALVMEAVGDADCTFGGLDTTTTEFVMAAFQWRQPISIPGSRSVGNDKSSTPGSCY